MRDDLKVFLAELRQHPLFPELLKAVETPEMPRFRQSRADDIEAERAKWIFQSGALSQHERWIALLTGETTHTEENHD